MNRTKGNTIKAECPAGMTVEAALALPAFIMAMVTILYILNVYYVHMVVNQETQNAARIIGSLAYAYENGDDEGRICTELLSQAALSAYITSQVRKDPLAASMLKGAVTCPAGEILKDGQTVDIRVIYSLKLPFDLFRPSGLNYARELKFHAWTGYSPERSAGDGQEVHVYVTPYGNVYHMSADCSYLKPSVRSVYYRDVEKLRNLDGDIYYPCGCCKDMTGVGTVFITEYGNTYHADRQCSGIKRTIETVSLNEVSGRRPCSKCGDCRE